MKQIVFMILWALLLSVSVKTFGANTITLPVPAHREDGKTVLPVSEVKSIRALCGTQSTKYTDFYLYPVNNNVVVEADLAQIAGHGPGTYYCVFTAIDVDGRESLFSSEQEVMIEAVTEDSQRPGRVYAPVNKILIIIDWQ